MTYNRKTQDKFVLMGICDKFIGWEKIEEFDNLSEARIVLMEQKEDKSGEYKLTRIRSKIQEV